MVGRCLHALAYVLTFPAAALVVDFIGAELEDRGSHIVLGAVNAFVLWNRAGHTLVSAVLDGLLALQVFGPPISSAYTKVRTSGRVERSLNEIPRPHPSAAVHSEGICVLRADGGPTNDDASVEGLAMFTDESARDPSMPMSEAGRAKGLRRARSTGKKTIYSLSIGCDEDYELTRGRTCLCKPGLAWLSADR